MMNIPTSSITIPTNKGLVTVGLQQIVRIEGVSNYSRIFFSTGQHPLTVARVLKRFEEELPPGLFIRSHRTHLINKDFVECIRIQGRQRYLQLRNGECVAISRRKKTAVLQMAV